uniref:Uncharacterized protein n=1 Tax=Anguilla anguilla TaxID=7936 RepID=A0A0E9QPD4_ANGAN
MNNIIKVMTTRHIIVSDTFITDLQLLLLYEQMHRLATACSKN